MRVSISVVEAGVEDENVHFHTRAFFGMACCSFITASEFSKKKKSHLISNEEERLKVVMEIHRSVALLIFIHQGVSTQAFCHYGGSRPPFCGGAWEAGDTGRPRTVYSTRGVRTVDVCWLGLRFLLSDTQEKRNFNMLICIFAKSVYVAFEKHANNL